MCSTNTHSHKWIHLPPPPPPTRPCMHSFRCVCVCVCVCVFPSPSLSALQASLYDILPSSLEKGCPGPVFGVCPFPRLRHDPALKPPPPPPPPPPHNHPPPFAKPAPFRCDTLSLPLVHPIVRRPPRLALGREALSVCVIKDVTFIDGNSVAPGTRRGQTMQGAYQAQGQNTHWLFAQVTVISLSVRGPLLVCVCVCVCEPFCGLQIARSVASVECSLSLSSSSLSSSLLP